MYLSKKIYFSQSSRLNNEKKIPKKRNHTKMKRYEERLYNTCNY